MKITFVTSTLTSGGSERVISLLANNLAERGYQVEIIGLMKHFVFYPISGKVRVTFAENCGKKSIIAKMMWLREYVKENKPDVVIPFMIPVYLTTLLSLVGMRVPIITSERNDPASFSLPWRLARRILLPTATCHVVQTQKIKDYYTEDIRKKTVIIYNPVTEKVFHQKPEPKEDVFINVARLFPQKNQRMLINAFASIGEQLPGWKLKIYGEGPLREELQSQIEQLGLHDRVLLCGRSEQVLEEMNRSKVFVMSSNNEGLSNSMIEALCLGLPIVTTKVSGTEELVEDGKNGFLCNIGDEKALAELMLKTAQDGNMNNMSEQNKAKANLFKEEQIVDQWEKLITQIISSEANIC